jgi:hypothetical protein
MQPNRSPPTSRTAAQLTTTDAAGRDWTTRCCASSTQPARAAALRLLLHEVAFRKDARADGRPGRNRAAVNGAVAGLRRHEPASKEVGMFYLDRDADLDMPQEGWSAG